LVYQTKVQDVTELRRRITAVCETVTQWCCKHLARGGVSSHLSGHQERTRGDLLMSVQKLASLCILQ
jgi:hypothetical protein